MAAGLALVLAGFAAAATASAQGGGGGGGSAAGVLEAEGDGIAAAAGSLTIKMCAEEGILLTKGTVQVEDGAFTDDVGWLGLHVYFGFAGCATIGGEDAGMGMMTSANRRGRAAALVVGSGLTLRAEGKGVAFLKGEGTWSNTNGESGDWSDDGVILRIGGKKANCEVQAMRGGHDKPACGTPTATPSEEPDPEPTATPTETP